MKTLRENSGGGGLRHAPRFFLYIVLVLLLAACETSTGSSDRVKLVITPVDTPTATPLAAPTVAPTTYTVRSGDTLSGIASLFGISVDEIVRTNNIADPNSLSEGQVLTIPGRSAQAAGTPTEEGGGTPGAATPNAQPTGFPLGSPTLPPPDVTPPMGPTTGTNSTPESAISPTAEP